MGVGGEAPRASQALLQEDGQDPTLEEGEEEEERGSKVGDTVTGEQRPRPRGNPLLPAPPNVLQEGPIPPLPVVPGPGGPPATSIICKTKLETCFNGAADRFSYFVVAVTTSLNRWGHYFENDSQMEYVASCLEGLVAEWFVGLHKMNAPELHSVCRFVMALRAQFENPTVLDTTQAELRQLRQ